MQLHGFAWTLSVFLALPAGTARGQAFAVTLTPDAVEAGSPELIRVEAPHAVSLEGEWLGRKLEFFRGRDRRAWFALAGVDVEAEAGPSTLKISLAGQGRRERVQPRCRDSSRALQHRGAHRGAGVRRARAGGAQAN